MGTVATDLQAAAAASRLALGADDGVDLHLHTVVSDGRWEPAGLMAAAAAAGVRLAAVTDHDATEAIAPAAAAAAPLGLRVLPGVELTAGYKGELLHVVALGIDPALPALVALLEDVHRREHARASKLLDRLLHQGAISPPADVLAATHREPRLSQAKLVPLMRACGYLTQAEYRPVLKRAMTESFCTTPLEQIAAALRPAGVPLIVAHPGAPMLEYEPVTRNLTGDHLRELLAARLVDGLEVYTTKHTPAQVSEFLALVARYDLLVSCGSDSHSASGPLPTAFPAARCRALLERCGVDVR